MKKKCNFAHLVEGKCNGCGEIIGSKPTSICAHPEFMDIGEEVKQKEDLVRQPVRWGRRIMCAFCGERRILWTDGEVEIL